MNIRDRFAPITLELLGVAIVGIILVLMRWASPVLTPILFAWFLTAISLPIYNALKKRGMNRGLSLVILVLGMLAIGLLIGALLFVGARHLSAGLETYGGLFDAQMAHVDAILDSANIASGIVTNEQMSSLLKRIAGATVAVASDFLVSVVLTAFLLLESERFARILSEATAAHPMMQQMPEAMRTAVAYFGIRTRLNFLTGIGFALLLLLLGVDYWWLWGILAFFLSYIPYIGLAAAMIPPSLLAFAEYGPLRALIVIIGATAINLTIENVLEPSYTGKRLSLSPSVVFVSFFFWIWLLGPVGGILSMPITVMLLLVLASDEHTQWLARIISRDGTLPQEQSAEVTTKDNGD